MSKVDQLLAKALSTTSEEEAIACLRMARKQPGVSRSDATVNDSVDWKSKAEHYYTLSKSLQGDVRTARSSYEFIYKQLMEYYRKNDSLRSELYTTRKEVRELRSWSQTKNYIFGVSAIIAASLVFIVLL